MLQFTRRSESRFTMVDLAYIVDKSIDLANNDYDLKKKYDFRNIEVVRSINPTCRRCIVPKPKLSR